MRKFEEAERVVCVVRKPAGYCALRGTVKHISEDESELFVAWAQGDDRWEGSDSPVPAALAVHDTPANFERALHVANRVQEGFVHYEHKAFERASQSLKDLS